MLSINEEAEVRYLIDNLLNIVPIKRGTPEKPLIIERGTAYYILKNFTHNLRDGIQLFIKYLENN